MTRWVLALVFAGFAGNADAERLAFRGFTIDLVAGWTHRVENRTLEADRPAELVSISRPEGPGVLRIQSYAAPRDGSQDLLRNMTNVDMSTALSWQNWGEFSGYVHEYDERGSFYRQWWLARERTLIFITYRCDTGLQGADIELVDAMVRSLAIERP